MQWMAYACVVLILLLPLSVAALSASLASDWCPLYHTIKSHYDPSGIVRANGVWHVFPDTAGNDLDDPQRRCGPGGGSWCHYYSTDLLRWTMQNETGQLADGDTGSMSVDGSGNLVALFPTTKGPLGLMRQEPVGGKLSASTVWKNATSVFQAPRVFRAGFRDPSRALKLPDSADTYVRCRVSRAARITAMSS